MNVAAPTAEKDPASVLVYDGQCRLCVTAKSGLERLDSNRSSPRLRMIPYQSEEAKRLLGEAYRPGRPEAAYLIGPRGQITRGVDAFIPLFDGLKGGRFLSALFRVPLVKPLAYLLYPGLARWRYRLFGEVTRAQQP